MKYKALLSILVFVLANTWAPAQQFSLNTPVVSDDQVLNSGLSVAAFDFDDDLFATTTTVNGVEFTGVDSMFTLTGFGSYVAGDDSMVSTLSLTLGNILAVGMDAMGMTELSIGGLTSGQTYDLQLFAGGAGTSGSEKITDGSSSGDLAYGGSGNGVYSITDTFTAGNTDEIVTFTPDVDQGTAVLDAINLRQELTATPEPPPAALLIGGVFLVLGVAGRRRGLI